MENVCTECLFFQIGSYDIIFLPMTEQPQNTTQEPKPGMTAEEKGRLIGLSVVVLLVIAGVIAGAVFLFQSEPESTSHIRDVFIIFMALEGLILGVALVILMVQLAVLINLLQNEIKPILKATNETVNTVKGTTEFLSAHLSEPVVKLNGYLAGLTKLLDLLHLGRK
jgi:hypothetical protein